MRDPNPTEAMIDLSTASTTLASMLVTIRADLDGAGYATPDADAMGRRSRPSDFELFDAAWTFHENIERLRSATPPTMVWPMPAPTPLAPRAGGKRKRRCTTRRRVHAA